MNFCFVLIFFCLLSGLPQSVSKMQKFLSPYWTKLESSSLGPVDLLFMQEQKAKLKDSGKCFSNNPPSYFCIHIHAHCMRVRNPFESVMMMISEKYCYITTNFKVSWIISP